MAFTVSLATGGHAFEISTDLADTNGAITVYRNVNGINFPVRGFTGVTDSLVTGYDVDFPQNTPFSYEVRSIDDPTVVLATAAGTTTGIDFGADWILGTADVTYGTNVIVSNMGPVTRPTKSEVLRVLRRRDAIVVTDRRWSEEFELTLATLNLVQRQLLEDILERYPTVTFSPRYPSLYGFDVAWHISVGDVTETRVSNLGYMPERLWTFSATKVVAPAEPRIETLSAEWIDPDFWAAGGFNLE